MEKSTLPPKETQFSTAFLPIGLFIFLLLYGLFVHPQFVGDSMLPVEILVLMVLCFNACHLLYQGYEWPDIQNAITTKVGESIPVVLILLSVGVLIGSWIICGTIPMLIYYGISVVSPDWIYIFSFLICIIFSLLTGTSWGSAGTIGIVMLGIADLYDANLSITAAAIVGGSFFGDKMSPLSDTTNIASLAAGVPLFDHIGSMMYTTIPSAVITVLIYTLLSPAMYGTEYDQSLPLSGIQDALTDIRSVFNFHLILLLPMIVVIWGSLKQKPIILTLLSSAGLAMIVALFIQSFSLSQIFETLSKGFSADMIPSDTTIRSDILNILNRGGLYNLIEGVVICILIFAFIGTLEVTNAIQVTLKKVMESITSRPTTVLSSLFATLITNLTTSNQYATSFIVGTAFGKKYDQMKIPRKVLSRSLEDAGTMMENLAPWTPSGIFMAGALGVSSLQYAPYQFLSLSNIIIAIFFASTGIACFYKK